MTAEQGGRCYICGGAGVQLGNGTRGLVLDHCHTTGEPRAMLCTRCNVAVGCVREKPRVAEALLNYVRLCARFKTM